MIEVADARSFAPELIAELNFLEAMQRVIFSGCRGRDEWQYGKEESGLDHAVSLSGWPGGVKNR
jgi:hypothetical protein